MENPPIALRTGNECVTLSSSSKKKKSQQSKIQSIYGKVEKNNHYDIGDLLELILPVLESCIMDHPEDEYTQLCCKLVVYLLVKNEPAGIECSVYGAAREGREKHCTS
jgi:hypothetical protein